MVHINQIRGENVYHIYESVGVFCSLIIGSTGALLIDTGYGFGDIYSVVKRITSLPIKVINTHGHADHIQGNTYFDEVMIHKNDIQLLKEQSSFLTKLKIFFMIKNELTLEERSNIGQFFKRNKNNIRIVNDGDVIDIGDNILEIIDTPGHTNGSICILDKKNRILFSGDSFSSHIWLFLKESSSIHTYIHSICKVMERENEFDVILSSHSLAEFRPSILSKIEHCAKHINIVESTEYDTHLAGKALLYVEGFDRIRNKYGYKNFEEFIHHTNEVSLQDLVDIEFTSIVYTKEKLE